MLIKALGSTLIPVAVLSRAGLMLLFRDAKVGNSPKVKVITFFFPPRVVFLPRICQNWRLHHKLYTYILTTTQKAGPKSYFSESCSGSLNQCKSIAYAPFKHYICAYSSSKRCPDSRAPVLRSVFQLIFLYRGTFSQRKISWRISESEASWGPWVIGTMGPLSCFAQSEIQFGFGDHMTSRSKYLICFSSCIRSFKPPEGEELTTLISNVQWHLQRLNCHLTSHSTQHLRIFWTDPMKGSSTLHDGNDRFLTSSERQH